LPKLGFTKPYLGQHTTHPKQPKRPTQYCQEGHRLTGNGTGKGITDGGNKHSGLIITNGTVMNFGTGIDLSASSLITIELMDVSGNLVDGIFTGGSTTVTGYNDKEGGFFIRTQDGDYKLIIGGRLAARFDGANWDNKLGIDNTVTFQVRWARLYFLGNFMGQANSYYVQIAADSPDAANGVALSLGRDLGWIRLEKESRSFLGAMRTGRSGIAGTRGDVRERQYSLCGQLRCWKAQAAQL